MGEVHVEGARAEDFLNRLVTNNVSKLSVGQAQYTVMCHESGGIVDDLVIYRRAKDKFLVVVNASNVDKDFAHMRAVAAPFMALNNPQDFWLSNESSKYTQIAIQGRNAARILQTLTKTDLSPIKNYWFAEGEINSPQGGGIPAILARTGYTGEDGFEVYVPWERGAEVWRALLEAGAPHGLKPCGLGARDTLRLEMKYPLYGHELTDETHPLEAGLGWVTKLDKEADFVGKKALLEAKARGNKRALVGIRFLDRGIPRQGYEIYDGSGERKVGFVTSGTQSPSLKLAVGIAYVDAALAAPGTKLAVDVRGAKISAEVIPTPFYKRPY
jgi:aminomethyltransferase